MAIGSHQSAAAKSVVWITPPPILDALGGWESFDLDPCAAVSQPWRSAQRMNTERDADGLAIDWDGRVWLNPPYTTGAIGAWLQRLAEHDHGTALIFARTDTDAFHRHISERASGLLFLRGRLHFHRIDGSRAEANAGAPSVLCAYGREDMDRLAASDLDGLFVPLRLARFVLLSGMPAVRDVTWRAALREWIMQQDGPVSVSDAYRHFARHPKAANNPNWRAKIRQKLAQVAERVGPNQYALSLA